MLIDPDMGSFDFAMVRVREPVAALRMTEFARISRAARFPECLARAFYSFRRVGQRRNRESDQARFAAL
jgi:hypothetical protein